MFPLFLYRFQDKEQLIIDIVLKPLVEAYEIAKNNKNMVSYNENTITRKIVWYLKNKTSISSLYQKRTIAIILRPKEHITIDEICEPDIKFIVNTLLWMEIEAKRIYSGNNWSVSEYLGKEGIDRFLTGYYSSDNNNAVMMGYVQNGDLKKIISKVQTGLRKKSFTNLNKVKGINNSFVTIHSRTNKFDIIIYHMFLYFT